MGDQQLPSGDPESLSGGPYADHPTLSALPREVRQQIADQIMHDRKISAIKILRDYVGPHLGLGEAKGIIDGLDVMDDMQSREQAMPLKVRLASGKIDRGATTLTLYRDGTFTTTGMIFTSEPDRLVAFSFDVDSMRRKSVTGRGAAALASTALAGGPLSLLAGNNRGVIYVTVTGERSGSKTYTTKNPEDKLLSSIRTLKAAADTLLASPPAVVTVPDGRTAT